jgi:hypothetical protein
MLWEKSLPCRCAERRGPGGASDGFNSVSNPTGSALPASVGSQGEKALWGPRADPCVSGLPAASQSHRQRPAREMGAGAGQVSLAGLPRWEDNHANAPGCRGVDPAAPLAHPAEWGLQNPLLWPPEQWQPPDQTEERPSDLKGTPRARSAGQPNRGLGNVVVGAHGLTRGSVHGA